jgi:hypothetical protein
MLSYFAQINVAEKLAITLEPFVFHIQKNHPGSKEGIRFIDTYHRDRHCRRGTGCGDNFVFDNARISGNREK